MHSLFYSFCYSFTHIISMQIIIIISVNSSSSIVECVMHVGSNYMHIVHCIPHIHVCVDFDSLLTL